jgi:hypothetical protein
MRRVFLALVVCFASLNVYAQSNSLGINAGFGMSGIKNYRSHPGFASNFGVNNSEFMPHGNVGLSFIHSTQTNFGYGADLKYSWEGARAENEQLNLERSLSLQYIRIPIKLMYFFGNYGQRVRPKIYAGPSLGFLVDAKEEVKGNTNFEAEVDDQFHNFDIGIQGGVGLNYRLVRNTWFTADLNYYNGFRDIRQQNSGGTKRLSNNNLALNVGVNWGIGK